MLCILFYIFLCMLFWFSCHYLPSVWLQRQTPDDALCTEETSLKRVSLCICLVFCLFMLCVMLMCICPKQYISYACDTLYAICAESAVKHQPVLSF